MNIKNYKQWYNMKRAILKGLHCVLCGDEHPTQLHHFKRIGDYETAYDYWNDETQVPVCCNCHFAKLHIMSKPKVTQTWEMMEIDGEIHPVRKTYVSKWTKCMGGGFD